MLTRTRLILAASLIALSAPSGAEITLLAEGEISGTAIDQSGLTDLLEDGVTPHNQAGGFGSALTWSGTGNLYYALPDRGPGGGESHHVSRLYRLEINLDPTRDQHYRLTPTLRETRLLTDSQGRPFTGATHAHDAFNSPDSHRRDMEALRVAPDGKSIYVADEYGPYLDQFDLASGQRQRSFPIPNKFLIDFPSRDGKEETRRNAHGRNANKGFEGLAITARGDRLLAILEKPLIQDNDRDEEGKLSGTHNRIVDLNLVSGEVHEYLYPMEHTQMSVSEMLAVNDHQFLVIEHDKGAGDEAQLKKVFLIDIAEATDVRAVPSLATRPLAADEPPIRPVAKKVFIDLLAYGSENVPEKYEGMTFGPDLPDGRHLLLISSDNDFVRHENTRFFAFAVSDADLPEYVPQVIARK